MHRREVSMTKPKVGIFSLTCCEGCQIEILNLEDILLDVVEQIDIVSFRLAQDKNNDESFDLAVIEGSISTQEDLERAKAIRARAKTVIALGSCACTGGVQAMKNFMKQRSVEHAVYGKRMPDITPVDPAPLSKHIEVNHEVRGCPIDNREFAEILKQLLFGLTPYQREWPVCVECRLQRNACLLEKGEICLGAISYAGCRAVCPSNGLACIGCRGIMHDANIEAFVSLLKKRKHSLARIRQAFQTIYGPNMRLKEVK